MPEFYMIFAQFARKILFIFSLGGGGQMPLPPSSMPMMKMGQVGPGQRQCWTWTKYR